MTGKNTKIKIPPKPPLQHHRDKTTHLRKAQTKGFLATIKKTRRAHQQRREGMRHGILKITMACTTTPPKKWLREKSSEIDKIGAHERNFDCDSSGTGFEAIRPAGAEEMHHLHFKKNKNGSKLKSPQMANMARNKNLRADSEARESDEHAGTGRVPIDLIFLEILAKTATEQVRERSLRKYFLLS